MNTQSREYNWFTRNLANGITLSGFVFWLILSWVIIDHREWTMDITALAAAILVTDALDGPIARHFNATSKFGAGADRIRDKLLQLTMYSFFILDERVSILLKVAIWPLAFIEVCLFVICIMGMVKDMNVSAGWYGKRKMDFVAAGILILMACIIAKDHAITVPHSIDVVFLFCIFIVSFGLGVMSFIKHVEQYRSQL